MLKYVHPSSPNNNADLNATSRNAAGSAPLREVGNGSITRNWTSKIPMSGLPARTVARERRRNPEPVETNIAVSDAACSSYRAEIAGSYHMLFELSIWR